MSDEAEVEDEVEVGIEFEVHTYDDQHLGFWPVRAAPEWALVCVGVIDDENEGNDDREEVAYVLHVPYDKITEATPLLWWQHVYAPAGLVCCTVAYGEDGSAVFGLREA